MKEVKLETIEDIVKLFELIEKDHHPRIAYGLHGFISTIQNYAILNNVRASDLFRSLKGTTYIME